jgi:hypothetical protein
MNKFEELNELEKQRMLNNAGTKPAGSPTKISSRRNLYLLVLALAVVAGGYFGIRGFVNFHSVAGKKGPGAFVNVHYEADDVFPVYLLYLRSSNQGLFEITITNPDTKARNFVVSYGFTEFCTPENQTVRVEGSSVKIVKLIPYSTKLMSVSASLNATLLVKVVDEQQVAVYSNTWTVRVNACDEIPWKIKNKDYTFLIASWVTPQNMSVEELLGKAKEKYGHRVNDVSTMTNDEFRDFVKAIFNTVRSQGITYINNTINFGVDYSQRIRLPEQTLKTKLANSIDGSVLLASLFESAGLRPYIIILSGHTIVGVARPNRPSEMIYIETTLIGRSTLESILSLETTFTTATKTGSKEYNEAYSKSVSDESGIFEVVDVHKAREDHVMPIN